MFRSIRTRILIFSIAMLLVCLSLVGAVSYVLVSSDNDRTVDAHSRSIADGYASAIDLWVAAKAGMTAAAADGVLQADPLFVIKQLQKSGDFYVTTFGRQDKVAFTSSADGLPAGYDPTGRAWYKQSVQAGRAVVTKPYTDVVTKKPMVSFTAQVTNNGELQGVVAAAVFLDGVSDVVKAVHPTPASFAFLVDHDGLMLAHPDAQWINKPATQWVPELSAERLNSFSSAEKSIEISLDGASKLLYATPIKGTEWTLMVAMDKADVNAGMRHAGRSALLAILLVAALAALLMGVITKTVFKRLSQVTVAMEGVSSGEGDLTMRLPEGGQDEVSQIARAFNTFVHKITAILQEIRDTSEAVKSASSEIASGNFNLSSRTEGQAGALEETASAMEQLTATVKQNSDNANQASELALTASSIAERGGEVVGNVVATMAAINQSSHQIVDIIAVIDGIAFQTNILALNAVVEAARAGEQGRGFAVVASEVRSLAQRSAQAAKEIKILIDSSVARVSEGGILVEQAGLTMVEIVSSVKNVSGIVSDIAGASAQQRSGIEEINRAITNMDETTQQNAALVEQASAAAQSLQDQAARLAAVVGGFKLDA